MVIMYP